VFGCVRDTLSDADRDSPWFGTICPKSRDIVKFHQATCPEPSATSEPTTVASLCADRFAVDIGQALTPRIPHSRLGNDVTLLPPLIANSRIWLGHAQHRCLLGYEMMSYQGFPIAMPTIYETHIEPRLVTDAQLRLLATGGFPGTVLLAIIVAALFAPDWQPSATSSQQSDVAAALALFFGE
jgi:hypothetical protein